MRRFGFLLGLLFLVAAGAALANDLYLWLTGAGDEGFSLHSLGSLWATVDRGSLLALQSVIERNLSAWLWEDIVFPVIEAPAVIVFAVPGLLLALLCRPRRTRKFYR